MLEPRPALSNAAVVVETDDAALSVFARPRYLGGTFLVTLMAMVFSALPICFIGKSVGRLIRRGWQSEDMFEPLMYFLPLLMASIVLVVVLIRLRKPRGFTIQLGVVKLLTPDDAMAEHTFDLHDLRGAALVRSRTVTSVDLQFTRHRGGAVNVLRNYQYHEIQHVVGLVNAMVSDDRSFGFEVILANDPRRPR